MDWRDYLLLARMRSKPPRGDMTEQPYWKGVELALLGLTGHGARFPDAGSYTMLEFGVAQGASLERLCRYRDVLARRIGIKQRVTCVGFDTFAGLPDRRPEDVAAPWIPGDFAADLDAVRHRLARFDDVELVQGLFAETLPGWTERLRAEPPLLVSIDCDYYSSTIDVFEALLPLCPTGCVFYFDDAMIHYWSDRAGEMQAVREVNEGRFGNHISLAEYPLWIETREIRHYRTLYRLLNVEQGASRSPARSPMRRRQPATRARGYGQAVAPAGRMSSDPPGTQLADQYGEPFRLAPRKPG